ncbi:MAG TPA: Lrp/AsnC ligand binding domain-containing protein, partial [Candidatus Nitrosotalea sp.]|nr:Lrp/AsnC ligand binding domain-containing protein [Candidatus Nitrosotalea sp.]
MQELSQTDRPLRRAEAHIVLKCRPGEEETIIEHLRKTEGVKEIQRTIGEFDVLVKMEAEDSDSLRRIIRWKVVRNENVLSVVTLMCMRNS